MRPAAREGRIVDIDDERLRARSSGQRLGDHAGQIPGSTQNDFGAAMDRAERH